MKDLCVTAGVDEAGLGPIAGPAVFGLAVVDDETLMPLVRDSKKLSERQKFEAAAQVEERARMTVHHIVTPAAIDEHGMGKMWQEAVLSVITIADTAYPESRIVVDGNKRSYGSPKRVEYIVRADASVLAVSAASVIAKCRQLLAMDRLHSLYPKYGFSSHKGYGTPEHIQAIKEMGAIRNVHRRKYVETLAEHQGFTVVWRDE